jgi:hypothetical protein
MKFMSSKPTKQTSNPTKHSRCRCIRLTPGKKHYFKSHFTGAAREVIGYYEMLAAKDPERFVWCSVADIVEHCKRYGSKKLYSKTAIERVKRAAKASGILVPANRARHGWRSGYVFNGCQELCEKTFDGWCDLTISFAINWLREKETVEETVKRPKRDGRRDGRASEKIAASTCGGKGYKPPSDLSRDSRVLTDVSVGAVGTTATTKTKNQNTPSLSSNTRPSGGSEGLNDKLAVRTKHPVIDAEVVAGPLAVRDQQSGPLAPLDFRSFGKEFFLDTFKGQDAKSVVKLKNIFDDERSNAFMQLPGNRDLFEEFRRRVTGYTVVDFAVPYTIFDEARITDLILKYSLDEVVAAFKEFRKQKHEEDKDQYTACDFAERGESMLRSKEATDHAWDETKKIGEALEARDRADAAREAEERAARFAAEEAELAKPLDL